MSDRRSLFSNGDIAHSSLKEQVEAKAFADGKLMRVSTPVANVFGDRTSANLERQTVYGAPVCILEDNGSRVFGRDESNGYVGYFDNDALAGWTVPTHKVVARQTLGFREASIKAPNPVSLSFGSQITITGERNGLLQSDAGLFFPASHLASIDQLATDPVNVARLFLGTAYLWGGNSAFGIDCSGLVQAAFQACGISCPGDSDQQQASLGVELSQDIAPKRGDLYFWKGHVGILSDPSTLLHANGHHMAVAEEPLERAIARILEKENSPVLCRRRVTS